MASAVRAGATAGGPAGAAAPGTNRARGLRLGRPAEVSSSGCELAAAAEARHPSSAALANVAAGAAGAGGAGWTGALGGGALGGGAAAPGPGTGGSDIGGDVGRAGAGAWSR